jgi:hypothetical protein
MQMANPLNEWVSSRGWDKVPFGKARMLLLLGRLSLKEIAFLASGFRTTPLALQAGWVQHEDHETVEIIASNTVLSIYQFPHIEKDVASADFDQIKPIHTKSQSIFFPEWGALFSRVSLKMPHLPSIWMTQAYASHIDHSLQTSILSRKTTLESHPLTCF